MEPGREWKYEGGWGERDDLSFPFRAPPPPPPTPDLFPSSFFLLPLGLARENPYAKVVSTSFEFFSEGGGGCTQPSFDYISKNVLQA